MSVTIDKLLIVQLVNWLNEKKEEIPLSVPVLLDDHEDTGEQLWIQPLEATKIIKQYTNGDYIGQLPFAVYYQLTNPEKMALLDVPLWALGEYFESHNFESHKPELDGFQLINIEMNATPAPFSRTNSGTFANQAIFKIKYIKEVKEDGR